MLGRILLYRRRFDEAARHVDRATELNPNDAHAWHHLGNFHSAMGSEPSAAEARARATRLDPLNPRSHIVLSRALAQAHHYPAIDVLGSASRVFTRVAAPAHRQAASRLRSLMARHAEVEFLLRVGEYQAGSDPLADQAIERMPAIKALLTQRSDEATAFGETIATLQQVAE